MKCFMKKIASLDKGMLIRVALLILSFINQVIAGIGITSYASELWYQIISVVFTVLFSSICAWKNNDFTNIAQLSGQILQALKDKKLDEDEVKQFLAQANEELTENNTQK